METVFVFLTHTFDLKSKKEISRISRDLQGSCSFVVYYDINAQEVPTECDVTLIPFDYQYISSKFPYSRGQTIIPGNIHLVDTELLTQFPNTSYFWIVEYDVRYSGSWKHFLKSFEASKADLLGCNIRFHHEERYWHWWKSFKNNLNPEINVDIKTLVRAFLPIARYSRRALETIRRECLQAGWAGHCEVLVPSLLLKEGLQIEEIGGDSYFTPISRKHFYYSPCRSKHGDLQGYTSMRWRPVLVFWGLRKNRLYHPVKANPHFYADIFLLWRFRAKRLKKSIRRRFRRFAAADN